MKLLKQWFLTQQEAHTHTHSAVAPPPPPPHCSLSESQWFSSLLQLRIRIRGGSLGSAVLECRKNMRRRGGEQRSPTWGGETIHSCWAGRNKPFHNKSLSEGALMWLWTELGLLLSSLIKLNLITSSWGVGLTCWRIIWQQWAQNSCLMMSSCYFLFYF